MDRAARNAGELLGELTLHFDGSRQAMITTELTEIISGAEDLQTSKYVYSGLVNLVTKFKICL